MEIRSYNALIFGKHHLTLTYFVLVLAFISFPLAVYSYYRFGLSSYKNLFVLASLLYLVVLSFYLRSFKVKLLFDGQRLLYEKARLRFLHLVREQHHIATDGIKNVEFRRSDSDHQNITIACSDGHSFSLVVPSEDHPPSFVQWITRECTNKITEKRFDDSDSYKKGFLLIGAILLDIILIFVAVYLATQRR